ncbi:ATPase [Sphaerisporangium melleum]|uniref:ATPase n=1 Tax=Sphaerisporangium melleum TaxID=321316 RepID=A0A917R0Y7_9ACTN|nr:ATPase [Sphaerisporangium melleum]GII73842.1 ATPase [Sphaerisporangium melleum]
MDSLKIFSTVNASEDVWQPVPYHVPEMHPEASYALRSGLDAATGSPVTSPIGVVLEGGSGSGKTHLMSWLREQVVQRDGYFFLMSILDARNFWDSAVVSIQDGLARVGADEETQLKRFLRNLTGLMRLPRKTQQTIIGNQMVTREDLDQFIDALYRIDRRVGRDAQDVARALVLLAADDHALVDIGESYLCSVEDGESYRLGWGFRQVRKSPQEIVRDISRLLALTGPSVMAFDQLDGFIAQSSPFSESGFNGPAASGVLQFAHGLTNLREVTSRTLTVLSCLPETWTTLEELAVNSFRDRFRKATYLRRIPSPEVGAELVTLRLAEHFKNIGFDRPYPTWPIKPEAFARAPFYTPREILQALSRHIQKCLLQGEITELDSLDAPSTVVVPPRKPDREEEVLRAIDIKFAMLADSADVSGALDAELEDVVLPGLVSAGLRAWIVEQRGTSSRYRIDPPMGRKTSLHAGLKQVLNEATEDEIHWAFRGIAATHHLAALNRLRKAVLKAGLTAESPKRRLIIIRNIPWNSGPVTQKAVAEFQVRGGRVITADEEDLKVLYALQDLFAESVTHLDRWIASRRPTADLKLFKDALGDWPDPTAPQEPPAPRAPEGPPVQASPLPNKETAVSDHPLEGGPAGVPSLTVGRSYDRGLPVSVELEALRKHIAIFAGSGSGKTVLIRRIIEECALQGVSSIVLDPNNDLARLGDPWPEEPAAWGRGDGDRATRYLADTDVVIWTPGREKGRPLAFQPLPDFASVRDDVDEFNEAVNAAMAALIPRAKVEGGSGKSQVARAVLMEAVVHFGKYKSGGIEGLINLLADFPEDLSQITGAAKIADGLAQVLRAVVVTDPLFGGEGEPVDPGRLLTPVTGKRARVSVISFVGLQSDAERQSFVNQLQMGLFAWIKKNPAGDLPLGGLLVMDEAQTFAPSGAVTACTQSTLALASQARKYGLGLVFATQAPKGLHNRIPGNAATQFYGLLNADVQIEAAKAMARVKGGSADDIGALGSGDFYVAPEGGRFTKVRTPLCLTHHPRAPLTTEEVIARARQ